MSDQNNFHERILALENEIKSLRSEKDLNNENNKKKEKKEKKPRVQTEYNKFVSEYINKEKERLGDEFKHKIAFGEAAKKWTENKNINKS
jgi:hypothetical protein